MRTNLLRKLAGARLPCTEASRSHAWDERPWLRMRRYRTRRRPPCLGPEFQGTASTQTTGSCERTKLKAY